MFTLNTLLNIKIFNLLIQFFFLAAVMACDNSSTVEGGFVLDNLWLAIYRHIKPRMLIEKLPGFLSSEYVFTSF